MHPFYGPSERLLRGADARGAGLVSMAAYLAVVERQVRYDRAFPAPEATDPAAAPDAAASSTANRRLSSPAIRA